MKIRPVLPVHARLRGRLRFEARARADAFAAADASAGGRARPERARRRAQRRRGLERLLARPRDPRARHLSAGVGTLSGDRLLARRGRIGPDLRRAGPLLGDARLRGPGARRMPTRRLRARPAVEVRESAAEASPDPRVWEARVRDVAFVVAATGAIEARVSGLKLDESRIGVGGQSLGAFTAMLLAGRDRGRLEEGQGEELRGSAAQSVPAPLAAGKGSAGPDREVVDGRRPAADGRDRERGIRASRTRTRRGGSTPTSSRRRADKFAVFIEWASHVSLTGLVGRARRGAAEGGQEDDDGRRRGRDLPGRQGGDAGVLGGVSEGRRRRPRLPGRRRTRPGERQSRPAAPALGDLSRRSTGGRRRGPRVLRPERPRSRARRAARAA